MPISWIFLIFVGVPLAEFWLLFKVGSLYLGFWGTVASIIATGVLGGALARREGLRVLENARRLAQQGQLPTEAMLDGLLILLAGGVLLTPGFLTDAFGFLLLLPPFRAWLRPLLKAWFMRRVQLVRFDMGAMAENMGGFAPPPNPSPPPESATAGSWQEGDWREIRDTPPLRDDSEK